MMTWEDIACSSEGRIGEARRICIASPDIVGPIRNGGVGTACTALAEHLAADGHEVTLLFTSSHFENGNERAWKSHYSRLGIEFHALPKEALPTPHVNPTVYDADPVERSYRVYEWLRRRSFDIIHFPDYIGLGYFSALARRQGVAFENTEIWVTAHAPTMWARLGNAAPLDDISYLLRDRMERGLVESCDILLSPSQYMIDWMKENGFRLPEKTLVIPNLLSPEMARSVPPENRSSDALIVRELVFFGRLESRKGLLVFCDALDRIRHKLDPELSITFLGKTGAVGQLHSSEFLGRRLRSWTHGWRIIDDLDTYAARRYLMEGGRLAVIPSLADNSPYTVLECLMAGTPFIASGVGGVPELVHSDDRSATLFDPNPTSLAEKLEAVLARPFRPACLSFDYDLLGAAFSRLHRTSVENGKVGLQPTMTTAGETSARMVESEPLVTACILHYDRPLDLQRAVTSIQEQTYRRVEILVVDNGSRKPESHATLSAVERAGVRVLRLSENKYEPYARNAAAGLARGKYLLFMDDDNVAKPHELSTFVRAAERTGAQVLTCFMDYFSSDEPPDQAEAALKRFIPVGDAGPAGLLMNTFGDLNCFVERAAFEAVGGFINDGRFNHAEDWRFFARASACGLRVSVVPEALVWYRAPLPNQPSWRKHDRSGALLRAARAHIEGTGHRAAEPFILLAQGMFWKAVEAQSSLRTVTQQLRVESRRAKVLDRERTELQQRYDHLRGQYAQLFEAFERLTTESPNRTDAMNRLVGAFRVGHRRHFGLKSSRVPLSSSNSETVPAE